MTGTSHPNAAPPRGDNKLDQREAMLVLVIGVIGLGNIWRFPALVTSHGGSAFLLAYVLALLLLAWPLLAAELKVGRLSRLDLWGGYRQLIVELGLSRAWRFLPVGFLLATAILLSAYGPIAGWSLGFLLRAAGGQTVANDGAAAESLFLGLAGDAERGLAWHTLFWVCVAVVSVYGVRQGLLRSARIFVPLMCILLACGLALSGDGLTAALERVLGWRPAQLGAHGLLEAMTQAFYTLAIGLGMVHAVGRNTRDDADLFAIAGRVAVLDTMFGVLVAIIVAAQFAPDTSLASGVRLLFVQLVSGSGADARALHVTLYLLVAVVCMGSALVLLEPLVAWARRAFSARRNVAAGAAAIVVWFGGLAALIDAAHWEQWSAFGRPGLDWLLHAATAILIPVNLLLLSAFVVRVLPGSLLAVTNPANVAATAIWHFLLRYPARIGLVVMFLHVSGLGAEIHRFFTSS